MCSGDIVCGLATGDENERGNYLRQRPGGKVVIAVGAWAGDACEGFVQFVQRGFGSAMLLLLGLCCTLRPGSVHWQPSALALC